MVEPSGLCEGGKDEGRKEALQEAAASKEEEKLPNLSAAEFRAYNSMAEHMEYFVSCSQFLDTYYFMRWLFGGL